MAILFIYPRKGLFQITKCNNCGHLFECQYCTNKLTAYAHKHIDKTKNRLELVCHQCQAFYDYPNKCPKCKKTDIISFLPGIEDLVNLILTEYNKEVIRLDKIKIFAENRELFKKENSSCVFFTTRLFDPAIKYQFFKKVVFIHAENLLANTDYLAKEELYKNLAELFLSLNSETEIWFDSNSENEIFNKIIQFNNPKSYKNLIQLYVSFLEEENLKRKKYSFPPHSNLLLLTVHEKTFSKAKHKIIVIKREVHTSFKKNLEIKIGNYYPARFLKRRNLFSYHLLLNFPKNFKDFNYLHLEIQKLQELYKFQIRLNPRHIF